MWQGALDKPVGMPPFWWMRLLLAVTLVVHVVRGASTPQICSEPQAWQYVVSACNSTQDTRIADCSTPGEWHASPTCPLWLTCSLADQNPYVGYFTSSPTFIWEGIGPVGGVGTCRKDLLNTDEGVDGVDYTRCSSCNSAEACKAACEADAACLVRISAYRAEAHNWWLTLDFRRLRPATMAVGVSSGEYCQSAVDRASDSVATHPLEDA